MSAEVQVDGAFGNRLCIELTGATTTDNAGLGSILNPMGVPLIIRNAELHTLVASTGAANLSVGVTTAAAAATDVLNAAAVNGLSANHVYNCFAPQGTAKTEISAPALWTATKYLTFTGSASTAGYHGYLLLDVIPLRTA